MRNCDRELFASTRWKRGSAQRISAPHATNAASAASGTQRIVGHLRIAMTRVVSQHAHIEDVRRRGPGVADLTRCKRGSAPRMQAPHATIAASAASDTRTIIARHLRIAMTRAVSLHVHIEDVRPRGLKEANTPTIRLRHGNARNTNSYFRAVRAFI